MRKFRNRPWVGLLAMLIVVAVGGYSSGWFVPRNHRERDRPVRAR